MNEAFVIRTGPDLPIAAAAVHDGHILRPDVAAAMSLGEADRLREEDPFTAGWARIVDTQLIGLRSRFEVDVNRPRDRAVYRTPDDAWGLEVWREEPSPALLKRSLDQWDAFYRAAEVVLMEMEERWGRFVVLDLHTYNHRRGGPEAPPDDPAVRPEVNVGTGTLDRVRWAPVVDRFIGDLRSGGGQGRPYDVRENVAFRGGHFSRWVNARFPRTGCALAVEFRKSFMDEWTGQADAREVENIQRALRGTLPGLVEALGEVE